MPHRGPLSFIESDVADRPEDVGSMRGMFVESKRNEEAAAVIWSRPARQLGKTLPPVDLSKRRDNSNEV
jgi:hypothetical protein